MNWGGGITQAQINRVMEEKKQNDMKEQMRIFEQNRRENEARLMELQRMVEKQKQEAKEEAKVKFMKPAVWDRGVSQVKRPVGKIVANTLNSWL